jgi:LEA14-like dessication related protein
MSVLPVLLLALHAVSAALGIALRVEGDKEVHAMLSGPAAELSAGTFRGSIALNGSPSELAITGTVGQANGRWQLPLTVRYADVPVDWADRFRPEAVTYRLRGNVGGPAREWTGSVPWKDLEVDSGKETGAEFLELEDVKLTELSLLSSEAEAELAVRNPFAFPLKIAETQYTISVNGREVGQGATQGMILHPAQKNILILPIDLDHAGLLAAAGKALLSGGDVAARLHGKLVIRLKGADVVVPLDLSGHLTDAS